MVPPRGDVCAEGDSHFSNETVEGEPKVMPRIPSSLTGTAGEHFVAYKVSCLGFVAALPRGGAMGVDVLVSNTEGTRTVAIQVKTTDWAERTRGRGEKKAPFELQFPLGHRSAKVVDNPNLLFAFVDLRGGGRYNLEPDVYIVPSAFICEYCKPMAGGVWKMPRLHVVIESLAPFKNEWNPLVQLLT